MLCRIRNASACSVSVMPASILTPTDRTAALAFCRLRRPRGVSRVGSTFPTGASAGLVTEPSRSRVWSRTFIDCRVTKGRHRPRLHLRDLDASHSFYEHCLGLVRSQAGPPHAVVFETEPIAFALRDVIPGTDLASVAQPGIGAAIWLHVTDVQAIHDALVADGRTIVSAPIDGPFGRTFTFADPDGYQITLHDRT